MTGTTFVYVTYIATTPEKLWEALTSGDFTKKYWFGHEVQSDWAEGSTVNYVDKNGNVVDYGTVLKSEPYRLLSFTFNWLEDKTVRERTPRVIFELQPMESTVKLTLKHEDLLPTDYRDESEGFYGYNNGWPAILSNLKSLLETGRTLPPIAV
ncbi:SRPBCC family protein [Aneurinibacillus sp. Ricciae_BoGa-3]|uniref:SRPBCC family protein n=1 Tax=Aneurinibacillus sp. Ricciae_BoGa-3 TaxID=3022697 RepID=UPI002342562E|nr:SRPBCC family protein [Aneurinibacillus sp. Ricciae_BoGa-3]WCK55230.1 SRPBCC family protein [Aneurinibacillus sp. Ricciae_BoGa-3]